MISRILRRVKTLLGFTDNERDLLLLYLIENAISQIELYIHAPINENLVPVVARLVCNDYYAAGYANSAVDSEGGVTPSPTGAGELKSEAYENVKFEYVTSVDVTKANNSSSSSSTTAALGTTGYFEDVIVPLLKGYRKVQTL